MISRSANSSSTFGQLLGKTSWFEFALGNFQPHVSILTLDPLPVRGQGAANTTSPAKKKRTCLDCADPFGGAKENGAKH